MRIAIFTNNYLPNPYGVAASIESFRLEEEKRGHTVYIFAPKTKGYIDKNPNVFRYPSVDINYKIHFPLGIPFSWGISKKLKELDIDIIHSQHPNLIGWAARYWAKKKKVPLVFTWHTLYDQYAHFAPVIPKKFAAWWTIRNAAIFADRADQVIVPTPSVGKIIRRWGVTNKNIVAIPTGVEENFFADPERENTREKYRITEDEIALLLVCRLTAEKNVEFLVGAVVKFLQKNAQTKFILAGDGNELPKLKEMIKNSRVEKQVIFQGIAQRDEVKNIYAAGDVFVYASKSETQGMVISEALFVGLPIVALDAPGVKDLVTNQVTGLLVKENADEFVAALERLTNDAQLRTKFSENAQKIAREKYTASVCATAMLKVYEQAMKRKSM